MKRSPLNRVNSGNTVTMTTTAILIEASQEERATTIPKGSTAKRREARGPSMEGDDMA